MHPNAVSACARHRSFNWTAVGADRRTTRSGQVGGSGAGCAHSVGRGCWPADHASAGELLFVTMRNEYFQGSHRRLVEYQDLVYRSGDTSPGPPAPTGESLGPQTTPWAQTVTPDPRLLFRFSALTANAHRIHYDQDYAGTYRRFSWPGRSRAAAGDLHGRADTSMRANSRPPVLLSAAAPRLRRPTSTRPGCTLGPRGRR